MMHKREGTLAGARACGSWKGRRSEARKESFAEMGTERVTEAKEEAEHVWYTCRDLWCPVQHVRSIEVITPHDKKKAEKLKMNNSYWIHQRTEVTRQTTVPKTGEPETWIQRITIYQSINPGSDITPGTRTKVGKFQF